MFCHRQVPANFLNIKLTTMKTTLAVCDSIISLVTNLLPWDKFVGVKFDVVVITACANVRSSNGFQCLL